MVPTELPCLATRDRSRGVRPIGLSDSQPMEPPVLHKFHRIWSCLNFDEEHALDVLNADEDGEPWNYGAAIGGLGDSEAEHIRSIWCKLSIPSGTRHAQSAELGFVQRDGGEARLDLSMNWNFYMFGLGYLHPEWGRSHNKGPLAVGYDSFRTADIRTFAPLHPRAGIRARADAAPGWPGQRGQRGPRTTSPWAV